MKEFVKFTEHNDWEGETWNFWLQLDENEADLETLAEFLEQFDPDGETFELDMTPVPEREVDIVVKHTDQGYMDYHNKVEGTLTLPEIDLDAVATDDDLGYEWLQDNFSKGDIAGHFK
jgi:hypothetical protein